MRQAQADAPELPALDAEHFDVGEDLGAVFLVLRISAATSCIAVQPWSTYWWPWMAASMTA